MNKIFTVIIAILLLAPLALPAITMTFPNGGETLVLGASSSIIWTASGVTDNVKLILLNEDNSIYGVIVRDLAPGGSPYSWSAGQTEVGLAPAGRYKIRVSTMDGGVKDVSDGTFTIGDDSSPEAEDDTGPHPAGIHDFVVSDPAMEGGVSNRRFKINVTDLTGDYEGTLIVSHYCGAMGLGHAVQQRIPVRLRRGVPSPVRLADLRPEYFTNKCDVNFVFQVNPDHAVTESNYGNNSMQKKFCWEFGRDGRFFSLRMGKNSTSACEACSVVVRPADVESINGDTVRIRLEISLQNCGQTAIRDGEVIINESWDAGRSVRGVRSIRGIDIEPGHFKLIFETVSLERHAGNGLHIVFNSGDNDTLAANNAFHCHPNFIGF